MPERNEQPITPQQAQSGSRSTGASGAGAARAPQSEINPPGKVLASKQRNFIIAPRRMGGAQQVGMPLGLDYVEQALRAAPDIEIVDRIGPKGFVGNLADQLRGAPNVLVVKMTEDKAQLLRQQSAGQLLVEPDQPLRLELTETQEPGLVTAAAPAGAPALSLNIMVLGRDDVPIKDAEVHLFGGLMPASAVTDERGVATISLYGDQSESVTGLYVKPKSDYWTLYQSLPTLEKSQTNLVYLRPLSDSFRDFPQQQVLGWGQKAMRLDQLPATHRGQGVKIAIIDSGAATSHPDLQGIKFGTDITSKNAETGAWNRDTIGHGSHCAGIIAGADNGTGIRGFAPDAEVHICKQFPGGRVSHLIEALEYCIEKQIDVVNLSVSALEPSEALEQQILRAKRFGVACIAAVGNLGEAVQYPASSPNVLAVAAIGKFGEFPSDSYHTHTVSALQGGGFFSPKFTCYGPQVALCAPGVAILSSVPPENFAVWDGTSVAAAHVAGLAALVLAHNPEFQGPFRARTAERVERLFQTIKASAQPLNLGDPRRTGFGIPDVLSAIGLAPFPAALAAGIANMFPNLAAFGGALPAFEPGLGMYSAYPQSGSVGAYGFGPGGYRDSAGYQTTGI